MAELAIEGEKERFVETHRTNRIWIFRGVNDGDMKKADTGILFDVGIPEGAVWSKNILALKCDGEGDLNGVRKDLIKLRIQQAAPDMPALAVGRKTSALSLFVNSMKKFDIILIPNGDQIFFGDVQSEYIYKPDGETELHGTEAPQLKHVRTMEICGPFDRKKLSPELRKALRVQYPVACLDKFRDEIMTLVAVEYKLSQAQMQDLKIGNDVSGNQKMVDVTYPLRSNLNISLKIPADITADEAERLGIFFRSLYFKK